MGRARSIVKIVVQEELELFPLPQLWAHLALPFAHSLINILITCLPQLGHRFGTAWYQLENSLGVT